MEFLAGLSLAMVVRRAAERVPGGRMPVPLDRSTCAAQACAGPALRARADDERQAAQHRPPRYLAAEPRGQLRGRREGRRLRHRAAPSTRETKTKAGTIKGKFAYMSPEQCVATNVDRRTDVFALGVIVHELLTGRRLFKRNSPYETYQAVIECDVPPPSTVNVELDPALDAIIMKAVAKEKDDRYPTRRGVRRRDARLPAPPRQGLGARRDRAVVRASTSSRRSKSTASACAS